jgi:quercetin 2,3-dioxygenase
MYPMITKQAFSDLGDMQNRWLHARYHFSFASYYNPERMGFGRLRVLNDDRIRAGEGFAMHPHRDMEIITYVREGAIVHRDSLGNHGITAAGDVQVMSAGTGIVHSEFSAPGEDTVLYQLWIEPRKKGIPPRWDSAKFPRNEVVDDLPLLVSGRAEDAGRGALAIESDAAIYGGRMTAGHRLRHALRGDAYIVVSKGAFDINGTMLSAGDGAEVVEERALDIAAKEAGELLVIEL